MDVGGPRTHNLMVKDKVQACKVNEYHLEKGEIGQILLQDQR